MAKTSTERSRAWRARCKEQGIPSYDKQAHREYKRRAKGLLQSERPFIGCDGEGCGVDDLGRQLYMLFRMGERELYTGSRLRTEEILDFICDSPRAAILVGFAFGYDVTMILRDLPEGQARRLFQPIEFKAGHSPFVWYKEFDIQYLPKQYFKVRRVKIVRREDGSEKREVIKGSTRIIYETFGFFQKSFVKVIQEFGVGTEDQRNSIAKDKERRSSFESIDSRVRSYCALECNFLAQLMEKLRDYCNAAGIIPRSWNGAGKLAGALHKLHDTPPRDLVNSLLPRGLHDFAGMAYYGGRFEIARVGSIKERVYEYDIRSAYPAAMRDLPCLVHGTWREASAQDVANLARREDDTLYIAGVSFKARNPSGMQYGGLPIRSSEGHLYWPLQGAGVYWSPEIASAKRLGFAIHYKGGWEYRRTCDCRPFNWVEELYEYRKSIGSSGPGYPIKLGINSLYGLLAQRVGNGKYTNMIWAGLITAMTRAKLNDAISLDPGSVIMVATDAVYSLNPLDAIGGIHVGERLGDWERTILDGLFIVQPGLYWCPARRKKKSRGLSGRFFEEPGRTESFEAAWDRWHHEENSKLGTPFPEVSVPVPGFIGLKLALARNDPAKAGCWVKDSRVISFDYKNKRQGHRWIGDHIVTAPKAGYPGLVSLPHREFLAAGGQEPWENARLMLSEQPDYVDFGIPFKD
jgi:DNA polymerase type B, organellar and viral